MERKKNEYKGKTVNGYTLTKELGAGNFGVVYEAYSTKFKTTVACKFLSDSGKVITKAKIKGDKKML
jgi:serine/threonine protein kinase